MSGRRTTRILVAALGLLAGPAMAQQPPIEGEIRKIDGEAQKVTIRHGPIARFDMPAMAMVFRLARPDLLLGLAAGDRVVFDVERAGGAMTIVEIRKAP